MSTRRTPKDQGARNRQLRVGEVIRRRLAEVLSRSEVHDPELNRHIITVSEVRTSTDLKLATAYVMPLGGQDAEAALKALRRNKAELRHLTGQGLALKYTPDLRFELDTVFDKMDEARRIFSDPRVQADLARPDHDGEDEGGTGAEPRSRDD
jgi:ribosome-binding factor A